MPCVLHSLGLALVVATAGCSYDWTRTPETDGGHDGGAIDATAGDADASPADAMVVDSARTDSAPPDCMSLLASIASERAMAKTCTLPNPSACTTTSTDECGCTQVIDQRKTAYDNAVAAYAAASCPRPGNCSTCGTAIQGRCIVADGGPALACSQ